MNWRLVSIVWSTIVFGTAAFIGYLDALNSNISHGFGIFGLSFFVIIGVSLVIGVVFHEYN